MPEFIKSAKKKSDFPQTEKEVVFVGRSNAGKSTLLNCLYGKGLAYVGKTPGKTRMINFFDINGEYTAVDVPGYGYARRSQKEAVEYAQMMDDYFERKDKIRLVIMIVDSRIGLTADDEDMKDYLEECGLEYVIAVNKIDKLSNNQLYNNKMKYFKDLENVLYISAEKRTGIDGLKEAIERSLN